jgi:hypothetical protein
LFSLTFHWLLVAGYVEFRLTSREFDKFWTPAESAVKPVGHCTEGLEPCDSAGLAKLVPMMSWFVFGGLSRQIA